MNPKIKTLYQKPWFFGLAFLTLACILYQFNYWYIGIVAPLGQAYNLFLAKYFNYPNWMYQLLVKSSSEILQLLGYQNFIQNHRINIQNGVSVGISYSCYGLGVLTTFWSFILCYPYKKIKSKLKFAAIGTTIIIISNISRIVLIGILFTEFKIVRKYGYLHHEIYNLCVYAIIFLMIYLWLKEKHNTITLHENSKTEEKI